jgi:hypothetical protein
MLGSIVQKYDDGTEKPVDVRLKQLGNGTVEITGNHRAQRN